MCLAKTQKEFALEIEKDAGGAKNAVDLISIIEEGVALQEKK